MTKLQAKEWDKYAKLFNEVVEEMERKGLDVEKLVLLTKTLKNVYTGRV